MARSIKKRITASQKSARRKNIAIARKARKKQAGKAIKINPMSKKGASFLTAALKEGVVKVSGKRRKGKHTAPLTPKMRRKRKELLGLR